MNNLIEVGDTVRTPSSGDGIVIGITKGRPPILVEHFTSKNYMHDGSGGGLSCKSGHGWYYNMRELTLLRKAKPEPVSKPETFAVGDRVTDHFRGHGRVMLIQPDGAKPLVVQFPGGLRSYTLDGRDEAGGTVRLKHREPKTVVKPEPPKPEFEAGGWIEITEDHCEFKRGEKQQIRNVENPYHDDQPVGLVGGGYPFLGKFKPCPAPDLTLTTSEARVKLGAQDGQKVVITDKAVEL